MATTDHVLSTLGVGRRLPDDSLFAEGDCICQASRRLGVFDIDEETLCHNVVQRFDCSVPGCMDTFDSLFYFDLHYNAVHRYFCSECKKRLPSPHLLDLHLSECHDSFFLAQSERKPMYHCYLEQCEVISANPVERRHHCIADHKFPHDFRFDKAPKHQTIKDKQQSSAMTEDMEITSHLSSDVAVKRKPKKHRPKKKSENTTQLMDICINNVEETTLKESIADKDIQSVPSNFVPFSFGRGGRARRGVMRGKNWFQRQSSTQRPSTLETTMVEDLRSALPEPMT